MRKSYSSGLRSLFHEISYCNKNEDRRCNWKKDISLLLPREVKALKNLFHNVQYGEEFYNLYKSGSKKEFPQFLLDCERWITDNPRLFSEMKAELARVRSPQRISLSLPKGMPHGEYETPLQTAIREMEEETPFREEDLVGYWSTGDRWEDMELQDDEDHEAYRFASIADIKKFPVEIFHSIYYVVNIHPEADCLGSISVFIFPFIYIKLIYISISISIIQSLVHLVCRPLLIQIELSYFVWIPKIG